MARRVGFLTVLIVTLIFYTGPSQAASYTDMTNLFEDKLGNNSGYNTAVRPLLDQSQIINVTVAFDLVAIVEMDDINQKFITNGFLGVSWQDEILAWDLATYNYIALIHPAPKQIWRPRMILLNTLEDRDLFEDDYSPVILTYQGSVAWFPGSLFPTSCKLNLRKYPFDRQTCDINMYSMGLLSTELVFTPAIGEVGLSNYVISGEWEIESTSIESGDSLTLPFIRISFNLKRRSGFFIMNIVMPIVLLSFLNIMVFLIPVDCGEKISYGITVLLALSVFVSIVSDMLPRSSDVIPLVTIYLVVLLVISVCTVIDAIIIVWLHHREEREIKRQKATKTFQGIFRKVRLLNRATTPVTNVRPKPEEEISPEEDVEKQGKPSLLDAVKRLRPSEKVKVIPPLPGDNPNEKPYVNKYKVVGRYIDTVSFVVFMIIWVSVTIAFVEEISK